MPDEQQRSAENVTGHAAASGGHGHGDPDPEIDPRPLAFVLVAIAAVMVLAAGVMWLAIDSMSDRRDVRDRRVEQVDPSRPAGPLLQAEPPLDLEALRRWESDVITSYGWVDRGAGVARVPVEKARATVLEQGLPQWAAGREVMP